MFERRLRLLLVEDNPADALLLRAALADVPAAEPELDWAGTLEDGLRRLAAGGYDALLLDLNLGASSGLATLERVRAADCDVPIVVLTGLADVDTGVRAVQAGAQDFLVKGRADGDLIWRAVRYAVERHRSEQTIRSLNDTLQQRVDLRTRELVLANEEMLAFVRACAHDLRGPLRSVEGLLALVLDEYGGEVPADAAELLERARRSVLRQDDILTALTRFARTATAKPQFDEVDLVPLVRTIAEELRRRFAKRNVEVRTPARLPVVADAGILQVALDNLLSNAWKFTEGRHPALIEIGVRAECTPPVYFVRDNGVGFDPEFTHKLFKPFQRLHDERRFPGTGLGLSTVQRAVRVHGGHIWAEAALDAGATFLFTLEPAALGD